MADKATNKQDEECIFDADYITVDYDAMAGLSPEERLRLVREGKAPYRFDPPLDSGFDPDAFDVLAKQLMKQGLDKYAAFDEAEKRFAKGRSDLCNS